MTKKSSISVMPLFTSLIIVVILFQLHSRSLKPTADARAHLRLAEPRDSVEFLPLKDNRPRDSAAAGNTWFMSSVNDTDEPGVPKHLHFPSPSSRGRLLCLSAHHRSDGSKNLYALAPPAALPPGAALLPGLTVVSDTLFQYNNIWHGLSAVAPFVAWRQRRDCAPPERWALFRWGELRTEMSPWVSTVAGLATGTEVRIENFENVGPVCFERAVVFRREYGGLSNERRGQVFDVMRRTAREHCGVTAGGGAAEIRALLLLRVGARAFKDEAAVAGVFRRECKKVDGCVLKVAYASNNLTFCDQVRMFSETDILMTAHGAQMTNMIFMEKNSSVMEFFPKGWLEHAGVGQYVYQWMAKWAGLRHRGQWKEGGGGDCPYDSRSSCFRFYKDGDVGHDAAYFGTWMAGVLRDVKERKAGAAMRPAEQSDCLCSCSV